MSPVRTGVVGVGRLGSEHARILSSLSQSRLVGVHDLRPERAEAVAERVGGGTRPFARLPDLLEEVEALVVAVPTSAHHEVGRAALRAGCHLLVEKPLAPSMEEVDDLGRTAERMGRLLCVGRVERFNPAVRRGRRYVRRPRFVVAERLTPFRRRGTDVGVVLDLMIHDLDLVLSMARSPVRDREAVGVSVLTESVDLANVRLAFEDGSVAQVTASRVSTDRVRRLRVFQQSGHLDLDLAAGEGDFLRRGTTAVTPVTDGEAPETAGRERLRGDGGEPLRMEVQGFLDELRGAGGEVITAREARPALELALRITREIEEKSHVAA